MRENECRLGLDFHGVLAADTPLVWQEIKKRYGRQVQILNHLDMIGLPSPVFYLQHCPSIMEIRRRLVTDPEHLNYISPAPGAILGAKLLAELSKESPLHLVTAMQEPMREKLNWLLEKWDLGATIPILDLRHDLSESPAAAKVFNTQRAGITHMIEDDPIITGALGKAGIKVIHIIRGSGKIGVPNSPEVIRYELLYDFAIDAALAGSVAGVFENKAGELKNSKNAYKIYRHHPIPCADETIACTYRGVCILTSQLGKNYIGPR